MIPLTLSAIKPVAKIIAILVPLAIGILGGASWIGRVDKHIEMGDKKVMEFDQSQMNQARIETKVDILMERTEKIEKKQDEILKELRRNGTARNR